MSTVLKGYTSNRDDADPHFVFESKAGPFQILPGSIISFTYDGKMIVWVERDFETGNWFVDLETLGVYDPAIDEQKVYLQYVTIEEKTSFTQPVMPELGPELRDMLNSINLKLSTVLNAMDAAKEREEKTLGRMSEFLAGDIDAETLVQDALNEYGDAGLAELAGATL